MMGNGHSGALENIKIFETQSTRVKSLSFHPRRTWILASLHTGAIQLWDYRLSILLATFMEHEGPVRTVSFHPSQNIFVSGGDDSKLKIWNTQPSYSMASKSPPPLKSLFTLTGHVDYIRSVSFHLECPWILSCSDDQTLRIWNWQSRQCLNILTGHTHYVMHASFSPSGDLIASCSLDQTVRIWDVSNLLRKGSAAAHQNSHHATASVNKSSNPDLFAISDVVVRHILEGHDRGVNHVAWHPSGQLLVSSSDDRQIKVWRLDSLRVWELDTYSGHFNNVSSTIFAYQGDILISNSEDKTLRVWDTRSKTCLMTVKRDSDRFWGVFSHPSHSGQTSVQSTVLFAAAHDSGFYIFKLERERPAMTLICSEGSDVSHLLYVDRLSQINIAVIAGDVGSSGKSASKQVLGSLCRKTKPMLGEIPTAISYNGMDGSVLATFRAQKSRSGSFELFPNVWLPQTSKSGQQSYSSMGDMTPGMQGPALCAVFLTRGRFVVLDLGGQNLLVYGGRNKELSKTISLPFQASGMFFAGPTGVYLCAEDRIYLYDVQQVRVVQEAVVPVCTYASTPFRHCVFSSRNADAVAFANKHQIVVFKKSLGLMCCAISSEMGIKSMAWDLNNSDLLYYSTLFHVRYLIVRNGENNVVFQTSSPVYIGAVCGASIFGVDRLGSLLTIPFDPSEGRFKVALDRKDMRTMSSLISSGGLIGQSMIAHLRRSGYPKLALKYVNDPEMRFDLAIECDDLDLALDLARQLDTKTCWGKLGDEALLQGRTQMVSECLTSVLLEEDCDALCSDHGTVERLIIFWICTGQMEKIRRLGVEYGLSGKSQTIRLLCGFLVRDPLEQFKVLMESGQDLLAYLVAKSKNLDCAGVSVPPKNFILPDVLKCDAEEDMEYVCAQDSYSDWPMMHGWRDSIGGMAGSDTVHSDVSSGVIGQMKKSSPVDAERMVSENRGVISAWGIEEDLSGGIQGVDLEEGEEETVPQRLESSSHPVDHVVLGDFRTAVGLLLKQRGITELMVLRDMFLYIYSRGRLFLPNPMAHGRYVTSFKENRSYFADFIMDLGQEYRDGLELTTSGRFQDALEVFRRVLRGSCLVDDVSAHDAQQELLTLRFKCRQYILGLSMELSRRNQSQTERGLLLAALFTMCDLEPVHKQLTLRSAVSACIKVANYRMGIWFARKLLEEPMLEETVVAQTRKMLSLCEQQSKKSESLGKTGDAVPVAEWDPLVSVSFICHGSFRPVWRDASRPAVHDVLKCSFCCAQVLREYVSSHSCCPICGLVRLFG